MRATKINPTKINPDGPTRESIIVCHYPTLSIEPKDSPIAVTVSAQPKRVPSRDPGDRIAPHDLQLDARLSQLRTRSPPGARRRSTRGIRECVSS